MVKIDKLDVLACLLNCNLMCVCKDDPNSLCKCDDLPYNDEFIDCVYQCINANIDD